MYPVFAEVSEGQSTDPFHALFASLTLATSRGVVTAAATPPATPPATTCVNGE